MFDRQYIEEINRKASREAAGAHKEPYVPFDAQESQNFKSFPFPFIGSYRPKGWSKVEELFCDATGLGSENEPALTINGFKGIMLLYLDKPGNYGYAVLEAGQFQCYIGVYKKIEKKRKD